MIFAPLRSEEEPRSPTSLAPQSITHSHTPPALPCHATNTYSSMLHFVQDCGAWYTPPPNHPQPRPRYPRVSFQNSRIPAGVPSTRCLSRSTLTQKPLRLPYQGQKRTLAAGQLGCTVTFHAPPDRSYGLSRYAAAPVYVFLDVNAPIKASKPSPLPRENTVIPSRESGLCGKKPNEDPSAMAHDLIPARKTRRELPSHQSRPSARGWAYVPCYTRSETRRVGYSQELHFGWNLRTPTLSSPIRACAPLYYLSRPPHLK